MKYNSISRPSHCNLKLHLKHTEAWRQGSRKRKHLIPNTFYTCKHVNKENNRNMNNQFTENKNEARHNYTLRTEYTILKLHTLKLTSFKWEIKGHQSGSQGPEKPTLPIAKVQFISGRSHCDLRLHHKLARTCKQGSRKTKRLIPNPRLMHP